MVVEKLTRPFQALVVVRWETPVCSRDNRARGAVALMIVQLLEPLPLLLAYQKCRNEPSGRVNVLGEFASFIGRSYALRVPPRTVRRLSATDTDTLSPRATLVNGCLQIFS